MKTGFEVWTEAHGTTPDEIRILLLAQDHDPEQFLNGSITTEEPVPSGRDEALVMLLARGRAGEIAISADTLVSVLGETAVSDGITSDKLPELLNIPVRADNPVETSENTYASSDVKESPKIEKKVELVRKKTKYSMTKSLADEIFKSDANMPAIQSIRAARMFLLSLSEYKAQDVAIMSDEEIQAEIVKNYVCVSVETGVLILPKSNYMKIKEILSGNDNYFVANPD